MSNTLEAPDGVRLGNEKLVLVTSAAGTKLSSLIEREQKGNYLRVKITGGGCNGLSYKMKFVLTANLKVRCFTGTTMVKSVGRSRCARVYM